MTGDSLRLALDAILVTFVATVVYTDWRYRRIPNAVTFPVMAAGLALGALEGFPGAIADRGFVDHAAGLGLAFLISWPIYASGGMKAGDGKLLMAVGALRGTTFLLYAAFYGALIGGVLALVFVAARRISARDAESKRFSRLVRTWIPYGVALGLGALVALLRELMEP